MMESNTKTWRLGSRRRRVQNGIPESFIRSTGMVAKIDQTNVYLNARRRKAASFAEFGTRKCVTLVNDEEQLMQRTEKREREEGKFVPVSAVNQMRANFVAPELEDGFTVLEFPELPERDSREHIKNIKTG